MITRREFVIGIAGVTVAGAFADQKNNEKLVAPCGMYCGACPLYIATQQKDDKKLQSFMKANMTMEDVLCDGCIGGGRVAVHCRKCEILDCTAKKAPKSKLCADC